ncbi:hypothetical protein GE061_009635 [Apolygus lucorum]|uniref:Regulatory protein zeste n=1 Tax=Apolygus lucorum TaxID=248454 RepID=A0A8S9Y0S2_APOLU|nr:hypothetical protein GE061_009635 [Apolygus lucorum]
MKYRGVIENKKSDAVSVLEKKQVWEMVTEEFNSSAEPHNNRTSAQLRKLWDNIKFKRKMELAAERRQILKTGGGPQMPVVEEDMASFEAVADGHPRDRSSPLLISEGYFVPRRFPTAVTPLRR